MTGLIMWNLMTLDGFVEVENRDISWHLDVWGEELERLSIDQLKSAGGLMFGRVTHELMANHWPGAEGEVADFMNALPKYVFSRTLTTSGWNNTQIFGTDVPDTSALNICVLFQSDRVSVREKTYFGAAFMKSAISPDAVRQ